MFKERLRRLDVEGHYCCCSKKEPETQSSFRNSVANSYGLCLWLAMHLANILAKVPHLQGTRNSPQKVRKNEQKPQQQPTPFGEIALK